jgi:uncharacterized OB-fold protein
LCPACGSETLAFQDVSGKGSIYQIVVVHQTKLHGFERRTPYAVAAVELDEQPRLIVVGNIIGSTTRAAAIGSRVQVTFEPTRRGLVLPQFAPEDQ